MLQYQADELIESVYNKTRWCTSEICGCLGCANRSDGLQNKGVTEEQWLDWKSRNQHLFNSQTYSTIVGGFFKGRE